MHVRFWPLAESPPYHPTRIIAPSRHAQGVDLEASCIEGGLQVGYTCRNVRRDYPRLAAPTR